MRSNYFLVFPSAMCLSNSASRKTTESLSLSRAFYQLFFRFVLVWDTSRFVTTNFLETLETLSRHSLITDSSIPFRGAVKSLGANYKDKIEFSALRKKISHFSNMPCRSCTFEVTWCKYFIVKLWKPGSI